MARAKVTHSEDGVQVTFTGDKSKGLEPSTGVIQFPGGHVEESRCDDGTYWAHINVVAPANVVDSRMDVRYADGRSAVIPMDGEAEIDHVAVRVSNKVPRIDG